MRNRVYIAIDLKSFYASVECRERNLNPLTAKLVVADASRTSKTICLAVTPALKEYGLSGRSRLFEVEAKAKEVKRQTGKDLEYIVATPRMALYIKYSSHIYSIYLKYFAPEDIHVYSIDEVFIDATSYLELYKTNAHDLTMKVIQNILRETGITATAGIAPNLYLAKIAMDVVAKHIKPDADGVRIAHLDEMTYRKTLWDHRPITDFWRVGKGIARRLEKKFIFTMGDIAKTSLEAPELLYKEFGIDAEILIDHAWGYEPVGMKEIKNYKSEAKCLGTGQVLHCPYTYEKGKIIIREMAELLALDLFQKHLISSSLTLQVGYDIESLMDSEADGEIVKDFYGRQMPKPAHGTINLGQETNALNIIVEAFVDLYQRIVNPKYLIRRINVTANNIIPDTERQAGLFDEVMEEEQLKQEKLQNARLKIISKFGKNAILKGTNLEEGATTIERNKQIGGHKA